MKKYSPQEAKEKIQRYCAYQERCHREVRSKLFEYGLYNTDVQEIITGLITEGFLNEERFARAFSGGKFRIKKWGRLKIIHALEGKGVTSNCIKIGLKEIDEETYVATLQEILQRKHREIREINIYEHRSKLAKYAIQKGYEPELVWKVLKELLADRL